MTTLLAFAFAFYLLLPNHAAFEHPATSFLKVVLKGNLKSFVPVCKGLHHVVTFQILAMMIGELEFEDNFTWDQVEVSLD